MKEFLKKHIISILIFIFALVEAGYIYYITLECESLYKYNNEYIEQIDSLINVIEQRNDSIESKIDTITIELTKNKIEYKKELDIVSNYSIDSDMVFFSEYLSEFSR